MNLNKTSARAAGIALMAIVGSYGVSVSAETSAVYGRSIELLPRPGYDAEGLPAGSFRAFPTATLKLDFDDNIFSTDGNEEDDFILSLRPGLSLVSDWNVHSLSFGADADVVRYGDNDAEDHTNFNAFVLGRYDVNRNTNLRGGLSYARNNEDRGSPDAAAGSEPTTSSTLSPSFGVFHQAGRFNFDGNASARVINVDDTPTNGATINNDDRDRTEYDIRLRAAYEYHRFSEVYIRGSYLPRDYKSSVDDNGLNRDSDGYALVVGVDAELSGITAGNVFLGYRRQDYDDPALSAIGGLQFGANATWNVLRTTSIKGSITRSVQETTQNNSSGFFSTTLRVGVDHEVRRNFLIGGSASFTRADYDGIGREDDDVNLGMFGNYMFDRNFHLRGSYRFTDRDSTVAGSDYQKNVLSLQLLGQF